MKGIHVGDELRARFTTLTISV